MNQQPPNHGNIARSAIVVEAGVLLAALGLGWLINTPPLQQIRVTPGGLLIGVIATGPLLYGMWACSRSYFGPLRELMRQVDELIVPLFVGASSRTLLVISVLAGIGEECLFRGVLQGSLTEWAGMPFALITTSLLFGLAHLITPTYAILAGIIGAYLGGLLVLTDNLLAPVVAHALYDYAALTYLVGRARRHSTG